MKFLLLIFLIAQVNSWTDFKLHSHERDGGIPISTETEVLKARVKRGNDYEDITDANFDIEENQENSNEESTTTENSKPISSQQPKTEEDEKEEFYLALTEALKEEDDFRKYIRRVDCVIKELQKEDAFDKITKENAETFTIIQSDKFITKFHNKDEVIENLKEEIDSANVSCIVPGVFSVCILFSICAIVISCLVCLVRGDKSTVGAANA